MTDQANAHFVKGRDGAFGAYVARPKRLPAAAVVVLHEVFGVNADIRQTCDELAEQGFLAVAPDLFWRQEPGVDLNVTSEADWQHGLRLYQAYDRDAGALDVKDTANTVAKLPECTGKVAILGYCLGGLMTFLTAVRYGADAAVVYHGGDAEKYLDEASGFDAPLLMHLGEKDEFIPKPAQDAIKAALAKKPNATVFNYPGQYHAFSRHNGAHYNAEAAALANRRTSEFLHRQLRHLGELRMLAVEHRILKCRRSFELVRDALVAEVPALQPELAEILTRGEREKVEAARRDLSKLWIFSMRDHGSLTATDGLRSKAVQYEIGNPLTAERMTRYRLAAGLYAPLRVLLYEDEKGQAVFEYDLPSSFFRQFDDDRVTSVGFELDEELETVLLAASGTASGNASPVTSP